MIRKIIIAAFSIAFVSVQAISRIRGVLIQPAEVALLDEWVDMGCFKEMNNARTIPNLLGEVNDQEQCQMLAKAKGFNTIGLENLKGKFNCWGS